MELHDICDGCGRHPGVCMCSVSCGPEGIISNRPNPVKLADKLRIIASDARMREVKERGETLAQHLKYLARQHANQGKTELREWVGPFRWTKEEIDSALNDLKNQGFKCSYTPDNVPLNEGYFGSEVMLAVSWA